MLGRPPLRSCSGPCGFLRRPGLCVPGEEPAGVELEGQVAFSSLNWFETAVPAAAWGWPWVREAAEVMCSQTLGCSPPGPAPWKRRRAWCAGPRAGGLPKQGCWQAAGEVPPLALGNHVMHGPPRAWTQALVHPAVPTGTAHLLWGPAPPGPAPSCRDSFHPQCRACTSVAHSHALSWLLGAPRPL